MFFVELVGAGQLLGTSTGSEQREGVRRTYFSSLAVLDLMMKLFCAQPCNIMTVPFCVLIVFVDYLVDPEEHFEKDDFEHSPAC